jgi:6-phosphogluconate dehydrogenase (decarboxylating)
MYSLSNDEAVQEVVFGAKGILSGVKEGQIAIDMSTVLPATSLREREAYAKRGVDFLDAPVFGSKQESADGKLWIMAAGNKAVFEKVKPVLEHLGQTIHLLRQERKRHGDEAGGKSYRGPGIGSARGRFDSRAKSGAQSEHRNGSRKSRGLSLIAPCE